MALCRVGVSCGCCPALRFHDIPCNGSPCKVDSQLLNSPFICNYRPYCQPYLAPTITASIKDIILPVRGNLKAADLMQKH